MSNDYQSQTNAASGEPISFEDIRVSAADLHSVNWDEHITDEHRQEPDLFSTDLFAAAKQAGERGDLTKQQV